MTAQEFSLEFDLLWNNIMSNKAPGLNEYEKSLFLTQAQEAVVLDLYSGNLGASFESSEEVTDYLSPLLRQTDGIPVEGVSFAGKSYFFELPNYDSIWFKTGETAVIKDDSLLCKGDDQRTVDVVPVTQDRWYRTINSPFRTANERRVLRMDPSGDRVELYSRYPVMRYSVRYLSKPSPIVTKNLPDGLTIGGCSMERTSDLNSAIHRAILNRAVNIAKAVWNQ